jgi:hypothetical protein
VRDGISQDPLVLGDCNQESRTYPRVGRRLFDPPLSDAQSCPVLYVPSAGMDCRARPCDTGERDGAVPS